MREKHCGKSKGHLAHHVREWKEAGHDWYWAIYHDPLSFSTERRAVGAHKISGRE